MATYIAFLRAINLGATRKFPKEAIKAATEAAGGTDVETFINTGNVRLDIDLDDADAVVAALEAAYERDRGFAVPTYVFSPQEVAAIAVRGEELAGAHPDLERQYITVYAAPPPPELAAAADAIEVAGERCVVHGRAAHVLLSSVHSSQVLRAKEFDALGQGTGRTLGVLQRITAKWVP